jgi:putative redox protein
MSAPGEIVVRGSARSFAQMVESDGLHLLADEPKEFGGSSIGFSPYGLLLSALGTCTSMTVGLYARNQKWPLEDITVRLRHERIHARDCAECVDQPRSLDRITLELDMTGPLTDEQRTQLRQIAARCPVHRTLTSQVQIDIR